KEQQVTTILQHIKKSYPLKNPETLIKRVAIAVNERGFATVTAENDERYALWISTETSFLEAVKRVRDELKPFANKPPIYLYPSAQKALQEALLIVGLASQIDQLT